MKILTLAAACAAVATLAAAPAFAGEHVVAKLAQPMAEKTKFIAGGSVFSCESDACVSGVMTSDTMSLATCKAVAAKAGQVVSFGAAKTLDDTRLGACNSVAVAKTAGPVLAKQ